MSNVALQSRVIICRNGSRFYVDETRAVAIENTLVSADRPAYLKIDGCLVATSEIIMLATPLKVEEVDKQRRGLWQCVHGNWQAKNETTCRCNWGKAPKSEPEVPERDPTPEEKERSKLIKQLLFSKKVSFMDMKNLKEKSNKELKDLLNGKSVQMGSKNNAKG